MTNSGMFDDPEKIEYLENQKSRAVAAVLLHREIDSFEDEEHSEDEKVSQLLCPSFGWAGEVDAFADVQPFNVHRQLGLFR